MMCDLEVGQVITCKDGPVLFITSLAPWFPGFAQLIWSYSDEDVSNQIQELTFARFWNIIFIDAAKVICRSVKILISYDLLFETQ